MLKVTSCFLLLRHIDGNLNPKKQNIFCTNRENFEMNSGIFFKELSISGDIDFQIHPRRMPNPCFINKYFAEGLRACTANVDIQPVLNHHKSDRYMCAYFSKAEDETSEPVKQGARKEFPEGSINIIPQDMLDRYLD